MATTVTRPNYWTFTLASSTAAALFNYKYILDIYLDVNLDGTKTRQARLRLPQNAGGNAHFSVERIIKSYLKATHDHQNSSITAYDSLHIMPQTACEPFDGSFWDYPLSTNKNTLKYMEIKIGEEFSTTAGGEVIVYENMSFTYESSSVSSFIEPIINYADEWEDAKNITENTYAPSASSSKFLSLLPSITASPNATGGRIPIITSLTDYKTISWLNESSDYFNTTDGRLAYKYYDVVPNAALSNYKGVIYVDNQPDRGGTVPSATNKEQQAIIFAGAGGYNVSKLYYSSRGAYSMGSDTSIKYYTIGYSGGFGTSDLYNVTAIKAGDFVEISVVGTTDFTLIGSADNVVGTTFYATGAGTGTGRVLRFNADLDSKTYLFEIARDELCNSTRFKGYSLAWRNKFGTWDYWYFDGESSEQTKYKRKTKQERQAGEWNTAAFELNSWERGDVQSVKGSRSVMINTRYVDENLNDFFNGLLQSNEVQLIAPVDAGEDIVKEVSIPINIKDSGFKYKTSLKEKLVQYSFTFEYSHKLKEQI